MTVLASCSGGTVTMDRGGRDIPLAAICDRAKTAAHIEAHPERWQAAMDYLRTTDLDLAAPGTYELMPGGEAFAIVSEYVPRQADSCRFEAHRRYIDLQYVIAGTERMGITRPEGLSVAEPYVDDIEFYSPAGVQADYATATPDSFFVFFPDDPHRPSMAPDDDAPAAPVKKVVVKILY
ncbi:MAG: YhcH/YjgK/YiaL family protein [Bacteroides sp.]|nr:YhcH/YjgK/YiaL family protein [Bacteroides sp.]